jgi:hypothetical protein
MTNKGVGCAFSIRAARVGGMTEAGTAVEVGRRIRRPVDGAGNPAPCSSGRDPDSRVSSQAPAGV